MLTSWTRCVGRAENRLRIAAGHLAADHLRGDPGPVAHRDKLTRHGNYTLVFQQVGHYLTLRNTGNTPAVPVYLHTMGNRDTAVGAPRLYLDKEFLPSYAKLDKPVRTAVDQAFAKFAEHTHAGLHLEKLRNPKDPRIRTIRITDFWRGVVLARGNAEYVLLNVLPHDDANSYAVSRKFTVNQVLGVLEVRDQSALESFEPALAQVADTTPTRLFEWFDDHDLMRLGIDKDILPIVRLLTSEDHLTALGNLMPQPQYDALIALASGMTLDEAWQEISSYLVDVETPSHVDQDDLGAAVERTPDRYVEVSGPAELADILAHPFAAWRVFLHPRQRQVAYRPSHRGPVLVSGGAGTGKTVTVLHRAAFLARRELPDKSILVTTFNRGLADAIEEQLPLLTGATSRIDVQNVDRLANQIVTDAEGKRPAIVSPGDLARLWQKASAGTGLSPSFLQNEWEQVILAQALADRDAYLGCERPGRGKPIRTNSPQRERIWSAIAEVTGELSDPACARTCRSRRRRPTCSHSGPAHRMSTCWWTRGRTCTRRSGGCCAGPWRAVPTTCSSSATRTSGSTRAGCRSPRWASRCVAAAPG